MQSCLVQLDDLALATSCALQLGTYEAEDSHFSFSGSRAMLWTTTSILRNNADLNTIWLVQLHCQSMNTLYGRHALVTWTGRIYVFEGQNPAKKWIWFMYRQPIQSDFPVIISRSCRYTVFNKKGCNLDITLNKVLYWMNKQANLLILINIHEQRNI